MRDKQIETRWTLVAREQLLGKKIVAVRYMKPEEAERMGWNSRPVILMLEDETVIYAAADDEGNDGGALFTSNEAEPILPVLR